jgi:hypothetical protein
MAKLVTGLNSLSPSLTQPKENTGIFPARVRFTILDNKTEPNVFKEYGEWASIGCILFSKTNQPNSNKEFNVYGFAKPLFPNIKNFPLENEIVYIIPLPNTDIQENLSNISYYYFQPINIWNSNHHNAIPDPVYNSSLPSSQQRDYQQTSIGAVRKVTDGGTDIELGKTFREKLDIKPLQPFEGDIIYEGRWGQSIRMGSTVNDSKISNTWSKNGNNGDPIIIIRNKQYNENNDPWIPQVEDINKDISSVYLTSTQNIPINVASKNYKSYSTPPESPNEFSGEQIVINSGRLLFNSKNDSILFSSNKTINLNSVESVNIDSPKTIINSNNILMGGKDASESIILGDKFLSDLSKLLSNIIELGISLQTPIGSPTPYIPNVSIPVPAVKLTQTATDMLNKINTYKSKISKSK